jgi:hypothetical protein
MVVDRRGEAGIYFARGKANRHGVDVDFGRFGRIRADFEGHRLDREPLFPGCQGRRPIEARGRLEGSFRFRGEGGYVTVSTNRAKASYEHHFKEVCWFGTDSPDKELLDVLEATGRAEAHKISFSATYLASLDVAVISASTMERHGRVIAVKLTTTADQGDFLEFSPSEGRPQAVTVRPTGPLSR